MRKILIPAAVILLTFSSCGIYKKYQSTSTAPETVFGADAQSSVVNSQSSIAQLSWRTFFTDPKLQNLIEKALAQNTNMKIAALNVEAAEASLHASKLAYLPSLYLNPSGTIGRAMGENYKSYNLGGTAQWEIDVFGGITSRKRQAKALLGQAQDKEMMVKSSLVADVARGYHQLQILDQQLDILTKTVGLWEQSLETQRALMENGKAYSTSVDQMEASLLKIKAQRLDVLNNIKDVENAICLLLAETPHPIDRNRGSQYALPTEIGIGLPAELLQNRADVRAAERAIENAFYVTQEARTNFYPKLNLSGTLGWTNGDMGMVNPGKWVMAAVAGLTQPLFAQGKLRANLKISKIQEEELRQQFVNTVLSAGNEVNMLIADCQTARDKAEIFKRQVAALQRAYDGSHELMNNGKATYLEVLTAQESLLSAQLDEAANAYNGNQALINLYIALGGGVR